jgi:hypothetical protein
MVRTGEITRRRAERGGGAGVHLHQDRPRVAIGTPH